MDYFPNRFHTAKVQVLIFFSLLISVLKTEKNAGAAIDIQRIIT